MTQRTPTPGTVEGVSLAPVIRGQKAKVRESMFSAYRTFQRAVKDERYKLIRYHVNGKKTTQLFDLKSDPMERKNLADEPSQAARIEGLNGLMKAWMRKTEDIVEAGAFTT